MSGGEAYAFNGPFQIWVTSIDNSDVIIYPYHIQPNHKLILMTILTLSHSLYQMFKPDAIWKPFVAFVQIVNHGYTHLMQCHWRIMQSTWYTWVTAKEPKCRSCVTNFTSQRLLQDLSERFCLILNRYSSTPIQYGHPFTNNFTRNQSDGYYIIRIY